MKKPMALVTGASSGIGKAYALYLADRGYDLVLVSQDPCRLAHAAADLGDCVRQTFALDLSLAASIVQLQAKLPKLDVIVANAGITQATRIGQSNAIDRERLFYLLCTGVVDLLEGQIPKMLDAEGGRVVIVSSIAAVSPMAKSSIYAAAKAGIASYGASIASELRRSNVSVTTSLPGYVRTNAHTRAGLDHLNRNIPGWMWMSAAQVVKETEAASRRGQHRIVPGRIYRLVRPFLGSSLAQICWQALSGRNRANLRRRGSA